MSTALSKTQEQAWVKSLEEQGCRVKVKKSGLMVFFPNGGMDMIHRTVSDRRGNLNQIAKFRRHGIRHPLDTRQET